MKVNANVPQWVLDIFNQVDFSKIGRIKKGTAIVFLQSWANSNLLLANPKKQYPTAKKIINKKFDKQLLSLLNKYDYDSVTDLQKLLLKTNMSKWINQFNIPIEKNYESIFA